MGVGPSTGGPFAFWVSAVIAGCALLFTIGAFWWINARRGTLRAYPPRSFAYSAAGNRLRLRLPVLLFNTGAIPIVVLDFRVRFPDAAEDTVQSWLWTYSELAPLSTNQRWLPAIFAVPPRSTMQLFIEFGRAESGYVPPPGIHRVVVEASLGHGGGWQRLGAFPLYTTRVTNPLQYLSYSNDPEHSADRPPVTGQHDALDEQDQSVSVGEAT